MNLAPQDGFALRLNKLDKTYRGRKGKPGKRAKIDDAISQGLHFRAAGPNGAGKSTLINILAGTVVKSRQRQTGGWISMPTAPIRANIGIVPQELNIDAFSPQTGDDGRHVWRA